MAVCYLAAWVLHLLEGDVKSHRPTALVTGKKKQDKTQQKPKLRGRNIQRNKRKKTIKKKKDEVGCFWNMKNENVLHNATVMVVKEELRGKVQVTPIWACSFFEKGYSSHRNLRY